MKRRMTENGRSHEFWERKARRYPLPFEEKTFAGTSEVISLVKGKGIELRGARILDIGCGTGIYTLPLAREALTVAGVDSSPTMISILEDEIARHGMKNVRARCLDWRVIDVSDLEFEKAFNIVWTSMSPAVRTREDLLKMEQCSRKWCVYIGWGRKRKNPLMEAAFKLHGLELKPPPGAGGIADILSDAGRRYSLDHFETLWEWTGTVEEAVEDLAGYVEMTGLPADRLKLSEFLYDREVDSVIRHTTEVEEGIVVWEVYE